MQDDIAKTVNWQLRKEEFRTMNLDFDQKLGQTGDQSGRERGIDRVLKLFAFLESHGRPVRVADLPKALGAPRSTIYELVRVLTEAGLLEVSGDDNKVFFGKLMYLYGVNYIRENDLVRRGSAEVDRLSRETGETSELCVLYRNRQAIVHTHPGARPMGISSEVGAQIPIPWTASGRLLLSHLSEAEIGSLITPEDLVLPDGRTVMVEDFIKDCQDARGAKIIVTSGLINSFSQCLAAPIQGVRGKVEATICLVVPIDISTDRRDYLKAELATVGHKLSVGH
jgi:DNA-binding IclR family transcriptional regulator